MTDKTSHKPENNATKNTENRGGRPPKPAAEKRKKHTIYLSDQEYQRIQQKAQKSDLTFSGFMRYAAEGKRAVTISDVPQEIIKLKGELERIGVNVNQLTKRAHIEGYDTISTQIRKVFERQLIPTLQKINNAYE